ncbi:hypothetical protein [Streptomyces luteireticuli]|uniref:Uncharacterized protein n=1 Tax=Streptomyces luteireticuli TaxID=173858 RepID=A0ABN0YQW1_9ACTN
MPRYMDPENRRLYRVVITKTVSANVYRPERTYTFAEGPYTTAGQAQRRLSYHQESAERSQGSPYYEYTVDGRIEGADVAWKPLL